MGDADSVPYAVVYGTLALATLFLVEYVFAGILFSQADGFMISDAAALIPFSNSSWLEVFRWVFLKRPGKRSERRVCKRAFLALVFRLVILIIDLAILGLSLPHSIDVYEREVGSTTISFAHIPTTGVPISLREGFNSPCKPDPIRYSGFKPTASRKICFSSILLSSGTFKNTSSANFDWARTYYFTVRRSTDNSALLVSYMNSEVQYSYSHIMRIQDDRST